MGEMTQPQGEGSRIAEGRPWVAPLHRVDAALANGDDLAAEEAWHDAYAAALRSESWEAMIEVGDACLCIDAASGGGDVADILASQLYRSALLRACRQRSIDGVLRVADRLAALGDRTGMKQSLKLADQLAEQAQDLGARYRVRTLRNR